MPAAFMYSVQHPSAPCRVYMATDPFHAPRHEGGRPDTGLLIAGEIQPTLMRGYTGI